MKYLSIISIAISFYLFWGQIEYYFEAEQRFMTVLYVLLALVCGYIPIELVRYWVFRKTMNELLKAPKKSRFSEYIKQKEQEKGN